MPDKPELVNLRTIAKDGRAAFAEMQSALKEVGPEAVKLKTEIVESVKLLKTKMAEAKIAKQDIVDLAEDFHQMTKALTNEGEGSGGSSNTGGTT